ncbi:MAG TPA: UvrD-helicase domain-containing protein [Polyangiaceae bacterium]|nr:UvrD-helicase domain-containing protein [Polyangiaceae bacterium]
MSRPDLNPAQHSAVMTLEGPLLVLAGAGTGKTRVITYRIAELIRRGIVQDRILAVTFTNKAAREMRERALHLLGKRPRGVKPPEISTFHALCVRVLRRHADRLGYPKEFAIYDRSDQETLARGALRDIRVSADKLRPGDLLHLISGWKSQGIRPDAAESVAVGDREQLAAAAYARYQTQLRACGSMDFDDLLLFTEELFDKHPEARFAEATRFDHLLIDEYQDTNGPQYRIVKSLADRHRNLCVVGDDDQSIYGWRGADVSHILNFQKDWPDAKVVRLEDNYRSKSPILEAANTLIKHNSSRHQKILRPFREGGLPPRMLRMENETLEAESVIAEIRQRMEGVDESQKWRPSDVAILFRTNEQPRAFELELRRARIPYVLVGGMSFYDRKEVRDVLAYLRVVANPADEVSLLRVINTPARGIGAGTIETLMQVAVTQGKPLWQILPQAEHVEDIAHIAGQRVEEFRKLIEKFRAELGAGTIFDFAQQLLTTVNYRAELDRVYKTPGDIEARLASIQEFLNSIALYEQRTEGATLQGFLEEAALAGREDQKDSDDKRERHAVTLMTLHSAKGLEFPQVYMVGMEEGLLPHQRSVVDGKSIDEERRLCYVGVTRAQDSLTLTFCKERMKWGKPRAQIPSRFLMEMRGETDRARKAAEASVLMFRTAEKPAESAPTKPGKKSAQRRSAPDARKPTRR